MANQSTVTPGGGQVATPAVPKGPMSVNTPPAPQSKAPVQSKAPTQSTVQPAKTTQPITGQSKTPAQTTPTAFTQKQIDELNTAALKRARGSATETDIKNLTYAESKGYKYQLSSQQVSELDAAGTRTGGTTQTDTQNINYAKTLGYVPPPPPPPILDSSSKKTIETYKDAPDISSGVITSSDTKKISDIVSKALDSAEQNPLPTITDVFATGSLAAELPPELQALQNEIESLKTSISTEELEKTGGFANDVLYNISKKLEARVKEDESLTRETYDEFVTSQTELNTQALKAMKSRLTKLGLSDSATGLSLLNGTIMDGEKALREIALDEQKAIRDLRVAYEDQDINLALENLNIIEKRRSDYSTMSAQLFGLKLNYQDQLLKINEVKRTLARETVDDLVAAGYTPEDVPDYVSNAVDKELGRPVGFTKQYLSVAVTQRETAEEEAQFKNATALVDLLSKIPQDQSIMIGGTEYYGQQKGDYATGVEIDENGNGTFWSFDKGTQEFKTTSMGKVGASKDGWKSVTLADGQVWRINEQTGESQPFTVSQVQQSWSQMFPEGETFFNPNVRSEDDPNIGECGQFVNDLIGERLLGNSYSEKKNALADYEIPVTDVQAGDTFLMNINDSTSGHVGVIESVGVDPNGREYAQVMEQNWNGDGKITHGRKIYLDDKNLTVARVPLQYLPSAGTGTPGGILGAGTKGSGSDVLTANEIDKWRELGYDVRAGMTSADVSGMTPTLGVTTDIPIPTFEDFKSNLEQELGMSMTTQKAQEIYNSTMGKITPIMNAAEIIATNLTKTQAESTISAVRKSIERGDIIGARELVTAAAIGSLPTADQSAARGRQAGIDQLTRIQGILSEYQKAGGDTNLLKGTEEEIAAKLGAVKDPTLRNMATQIRTALIDYRRSVSGAAFTESELVEYKSLFPSISSTYDLNMSKIDGLITSWVNTNQSILSSIITPSLYNQIYAN
jgi:hypothetical protein